MSNALKNEKTVLSLFSQRAFRLKVITHLLVKAILQASSFNSALLQIKVFISAQEIRIVQLQSHITFSH